MADKPIMTDVNINGQTEKFADPQHFVGPNNEGRAKTGEKNPFPTKDDKVLAKLNEIDNRLSKIESGDTTLNTQLTSGSIVENDALKVLNKGDVVQEIYGNANIDNLIREEAFDVMDNGRLIDLRKSKVRTVLVYNRHDVAINLRVRFHVNDTITSLTGATVYPTSVVPSGGLVELNELDYPEISLTYPYMRITLSRADGNVPTTQRVYVYVFGGAN